MAEGEIAADVLSDLAAGRMSLEEVETMYESIMESERSSSLQELLGMSRTEWTAFGHGVEFEELARWRADGWPSSCALCGKNVSPPAFGWLAREGQDGEHLIVHVDCL